MKGLHPVTRKRIQAFRQIKRAHFSLWLLLLIYGISLLSNLVANDRPLLVQSAGKWYAPVLFFVPEDRFLGNGRTTRPDFKALARDPAFTEREGNRMIWPPIPFGPNEGLKVEDIELDPTVDIYLRTTEQVARVDLSAEGRMLQTRNVEWLGDSLSPEINLLDNQPPAFAEAVKRRFSNQAADAFRLRTTLNGLEVDVQLSSFKPRSRPPRSVRLNLREVLENPVNERFKIRETGSKLPAALNAEDRSALRAAVDALRTSGTLTSTLDLPSGMKAGLSIEQMSFPFRPVKDHPFGLDSSGRDVLVRVLYATRIALNFGFLLVTATMIVGIFIGALQGYFGGAVDLAGQRLIEIWEALPFLYIMMLLGSVLGTSFSLLLFVYAMFNWIGISYYMRAEFLRLRSMPFVDSVRVMGLPAHKIIFRHILPSSLVPVVTFFPFSLGGAIGVLTALDYLGFGLPPPTPSWGELLAQAQEFQFAWWLVLFPGLALFILVLLGVFIGEGIREAYDPRRSVKWEG
jgi:microcin C transport system permease protein